MKFDKISKAANIVSFIFSTAILLFMIGIGLFFFIFSFIGSHSASITVFSAVWLSIVVFAFARTIMTFLRNAKNPSAGGMFNLSGGTRIDFPPENKTDDGSAPLWAEPEKETDNGNAPIWAAPEKQADNNNTPIWEAPAKQADNRSGTEGDHPAADRICPFCGFRNKNSDVLCANCGNTLPQPPGTPIV